MIRKIKSANDLWTPSGARYGQLPLFGLRPSPQDRVISETNAKGSTVFLMIEAKESVNNVEEIATIEGVDVFLIGSNDLAIEFGIPGQFESEEFRSALVKVSQACKRHRKIMGLAGIYNHPVLHDWAINELDVGFLLAGQDSGFIAKSAKDTLLGIPAKKP